MSSNFFSTKLGFLKPFVPGLFALIVICLSLSSCDQDDVLIDSPDIVLKATSVSEDLTIYWGPLKFNASKGKAENQIIQIGSTELENFEESFILKVQNGENGKNTVSSATISIDGVKLITAADFKKKTFLISKDVTNLKSNSIIEILINGKEGTFIEVEIQGVTKSNYFIDSRDGKKYKTVKIGDQIWMAENLAYLPEVHPPSIRSRVMPLYYVYGYSGEIPNEAKETENYIKYGVLYNWAAAQNACPSGWHLPNDEEWTQLENYLIAHEYNFDRTNFGNKIAKSMAANSTWVENTIPGAPGNKLCDNNLSGFSALPAGYSSGAFYGENYFGIWWSFTEISDLAAWSREIVCDQAGVLRGESGKNGGFSVRCIMN